MYLVIKIPECAKGEELVEVHSTVYEQLYKVNSILDKSLKHCHIQVHFLQVNLNRILQYDNPAFHTMRVKVTIKRSLQNIVESSEFVKGMVGWLLIDTDPFSTRSLQCNKIGLKLHADLPCCSVFNIENLPSGHITSIPCKCKIQLRLYIWLIGWKIVKRQNVIEN